MNPVQSRHFQPTQLRGVSPEKRTVDIVASDFSLDSYGTRIDPAGWELEQFRKNPVICLQHDSYRRLPIATAIPETVRVENGQLVMTVQFPPAGTSVDADEAFGLIAAGVLRGVSVGFDPEKWEDTTEKLPDDTEIRVRIYRHQRLLETSFVTIPSNDNGLVVRSREAKADEVEVLRMTRHLEESLKKTGEKAEVVLRIADLPEFQQVVARLTGEVEEMRKDYDKYKSYFENKQPANRASTKVLAKFFKLRGVEQPAEEKDAWERMEAMLEETPAAVEKAEVVEEPAKAEEKDPPTPPPAEAPQTPERKASVSIPLPVLRALPKAVIDAALEAAAKASRQGTPAHRLGEVATAELGKTFISSLSLS